MRRSALELSHVLQTQHDRVCPHPFLGLLPVRRHDVLPLNVRVAQEAVGRARFAPAFTSHRDAGSRIRRKSFHQYLRSLVEATVSQVEPSKFLLCPAVRS